MSMELLKCKLSSAISPFATVKRESQKKKKNIYIQTKSLRSLRKLSRLSLVVDLMFRDKVPNPTALIAFDESN